MNFFLFLRKEKNQARIASFLKNPRVLFLFPVPILLSELVQALLDTPLVFGGWNILSHLLFYILGFILAFNQQFMEILGKYIKIIFGITTIAISLTFLMIVLFLNGIIRFRDVEVVFFVIRVTFAWSGVLLILWLGNRYLNKDSKNRKFLNELVLPFYILHQTVLIVLGFFIIQLELDILIKFLLILSSAFVSISILLLIIREENTLRFLFGMKMRENKSIRRWIKRGKAKT
jgi:hypothetical protein